MRSLCLLVGALLIFSGCDVAQPPVNRVQPGVFAKTSFDGEWYYLQTVINVPFGAAYTHVGDQSLLEKIVWEIQEHQLIARRSYEFVANTETDSATGTPEPGAAIAIYNIESHFDIRREYNDVTGEEYNTIVENEEDRPWFERDYIRIDWSQNLVTEPEFLSFARLFDGIEAEPVAYHVEDPSHPDAVRIETGEDDKVIAMDVVNKMFVKPTMVYFEDWGEWPTCWLDYQTHIDCASAELAIRHSFKRVDPAHEYQPEVYTGDRMERFGYFVSERPGYDANYGLVEPARHRFVNRFNLWTESYAADEGGFTLPCSSDDDCSDTPGSVCDFGIAQAEHVDEGSCTIPYRERTVQPIVYYVSENFPEELFADAQAVVDDWNRPFVDTVGSLRELECDETAGEDGDCSSERDREDAQRVFVLCHNPVVEEDRAECGPVDTIARIGDVLYSLVSWVPDPNLGNPLGYGPAAADPETGEFIQGNAFIYGAAVNELATYATDLVRLLNGDLDEASVTTGAHVEDYIRWVQGLPGEERHAVPIRGADAERVNDAMDFSRARAHALPGSSRHPSGKRELIERIKAARERLVDREVLPQDHGRARARLDALRDTAIEGMMVPPEMIAAAGLGPVASLSDTAIERASPLRGRSIREMRALREARRKLQAERCVLRVNFEDAGLLGLARAVKDAVDNGDGTMQWYGVSYAIADDEGLVDYDAVREMLRHPIFRSTAAHEIGHTLGLRHNFSGSYDSLNYQPEYWDIRDDGNMRPRAWDPQSASETNARIREYQYSTVMDYGHNFVVTDSHGIGQYDRAAIKMGYGDLVEVFEESDDAAEVAWIYFQQLWDYPVALASSSYEEGGEVRSYPYTEIPEVVGGLDAIQRRADVRFSDLEPEPGLAAEGIDLRFLDDKGRAAVPYRFCSDEFVDLAPNCLAYDAGADPYESMMSLIDRYWNYYIFAAYRREQLGFDIDAYWEDIYYRYFSELQYANQDYLWNRSYLEEVFYGDPTFDDFFEREDGMGAYTLGVGAAFALFSKVIATPEPGDYTGYTLGDGTEAFLLDYGFEPDVSIDEFQGRYLETTWNFDDGYFWTEQLERVGFFYDKILALQILSDPETFFLGRDIETDSRAFALSFHTTFPEAMSSLFGAILSEDWTAFGPRADENDELVYPDLVEIVDGGIDGTPIDPNTDFSVQLYSAVLGLALIPLSYDHTFIEQARIYVEGGAEGVSLPMTATVVRFTDPSTNLTYVAASYPNGDAVEAGLGARMLLHAQALADNNALDELDNFVDLLNLMRTLTWQYGFGI